MAVNAQQVFYGEQDREAPFQVVEQPAMIGFQPGHAFHHHQENTGDDDPKQSQIEQFACFRIGSEYDDVELFPPVHPTKIGRYMTSSIGEFFLLFCNGKIFVLMHITGCLHCNNRTDS